ncbi:MAG: hypothetical protein KIT09_14745 [Bryobacteraceae bacterium]|nr:hypothetical protein [Bryobacteraceae bacterium]
MVDFRKSLLLLAILLVVGSVASAQVVTPAFQCVANAGVTPLIRAEGLAELVGDVVLNCTGGTPAAAGVQVQKVNVRIFLNVNVTSWLLDGNWNEALLAIDDPLPGAQNPCPANNCNIAGVGTTGTGVNYAAGAPAYNVFQGTYIAPNQVEWLGVPIDPPGSQGTRIIRITNVRANANQLGVSGTLIPSSVSMFISATGTTSIPINNPTQVVAFVQDGMTFSVVQGWRFLQCESAFEDSPCNADVYLRYRENFATAFKVLGGIQDVFGQIHNTENGFYNPALSNLHGINRAGLASQGTRLLARFNAVPAGVTLRAYTVSVQRGANTTTNCGPATLAGFFNYHSTNIAARVNDADGLGAGGTPTGTAEWRNVAVSGGAGSSTWEIVEADPFSNDSVYVAVDVVYTANTTSGIPALGSATVNGSYAPLSTIVTASSTAPRPRFFDDSTAIDIFTINSCATNLLFPYVTNQAGFDTGMVISNTSEDPFGTATQEGACVINYYGHTTGGGAAPAPVETPVVPAGQHAIWTLSSGGTVQTAGGTIAAAPGFQGYVIAQCNFQFGHGYAFISDIGAGRLAQGYLALIMDWWSDSVPRTGSFSEPLLH